MRVFAAVLDTTIIEQDVSVLNCRIDLNISLKNVNGSILKCNSFQFQWIPSSTARPSIDYKLTVIVAYFTSIALGTLQVEFIAFSYYVEIIILLIERSVSFAPQPLDILFVSLSVCLSVSHLRPNALTDIHNFWREWFFFKFASISKDLKCWKKGFVYCYSAVFFFFAFLSHIWGRNS